MVCSAGITAAHHNNKSEEGVMKKVLVQLFVIGIMIASFATPLLAGGGAGP